MLKIILLFLQVIIIILLLNVSFQQWDIKAYLDKQATLLDTLQDQQNKTSKLLQTQEALIQDQQTTIKELITQQATLKQSINKNTSYESIYDNKFTLDSFKHNVFIVESLEDNSNVFAVPNTIKEAELALVAVYPSQNNAIISLGKETFNLTLHETWGDFSLVEVGRDYIILKDSLGENIRLKLAY